MEVEFDLTALVLDFPRLDRCTDTVWRAACEAFVAARRQTGAKAAIIATLPEAMPEDRACALLAAGILPLLGIDDALGAIEAAAELGSAMAEEFVSPLVHGVPSGEARTMDEWRSKCLLAQFGVAVPQGQLVHSPEEAGLAAADLGFPVVLKATGEQLAHKSEFGAVVLGLSDAAAVLHAAEALGSVADALLVERMVTDPVGELIVGVARDPRLGPYLLVGSGGILAELVRDRIVMAMPATRAEIASAVGRLRVAALLDGQRGRPAGDTEAAIEAILAVQRCAMANIDRLLELDVNPVVVRPRGYGAVAVDAMIRLRKDAAHE
jgi:acetate---CoA ligase (ADP-forming)